MENILVTIFLYAIVFYVLCHFAKTKAPKPTLATNKTQAVVTGQDALITSVTTTTTNTVSVEPVAHIEPTKPVTGHIINSQSLSCIFVERDVKPDIKTSNRKRKKKQNISDFLKEVGTSEVIHNKNFATIT